MGLFSLTGQYLKSQLKWEQNHLGNYRKVYPNKNVKRYKPIMEYLERLKWPTLHKLPAELSKEWNFQKPSKTNPNKSPEGADSLEILDQIFKGLKATRSKDKTGVTDKVETHIEKVETRAADKLPSETKTSNSSTKCAINQSSEQLRQEYWTKLCNALSLGVMGKYNFIDRITYTKISRSRKKVAERYPMVTYPTVTVDAGAESCTTVDTTDKSKNCEHDSKI